VAAKQLKLTVRSTDYAIVTKGECGEWVKE